MGVTARSLLAAMAAVLVSVQSSAVPSGCVVTAGTLTSCAGFVGSQLDLSDEGLVEIAARAFPANLTSLQELHLDENALTTLPACVFDALSSLTQLTLAGNGLRSLAGVFCGDQGGPANAGGGGGGGGGSTARLLTFLDLSNNTISDVSGAVFGNMSALQHLDLSHNALRSLPPGAFANLTALELLRVRYNSLAQLDVAAFKGLAALEFLDLSYNALSALPVGAFDNLQVRDRRVASHSCSALARENAFDSIRF